MGHKKNIDFTDKLLYKADSTISALEVLAKGIAMPEPRETLFKTPEQKEHFWLSLNYSVMFVFTVLAIFLLPVVIIALSWPLWWSLLVFLFIPAPLRLYKKAKAHILILFNKVPATVADTKSSREIDKEVANFKGSLDNVTNVDDLFKEKD